MPELSAILSVCPKKLFIITSSGGGGLIQAANAKEQEMKALDPNIVVVRKDVFKDWLAGPFGFGVRWWNQAQIKGNISALRLLIALQRCFDVICWPILFACTLYTLFKEDVDHVMNLQPIGVSAILKALRIYNHRRKKQLRLQLVLVDLPTKAATHFFRPVKMLSKRDRFFLNLTTIQPLLENGQTSEEFWQTNCGLSESEVQYEDVYVRQSFKRYHNQERKRENFSIFIRFQEERELKVIQQTVERGSLRARVRGDEIHFVIPKHAYVVTILLGSQPASEATFNYVKQWIQLSKEPKLLKNPLCLFVFCSTFHCDKNSLFQNVSSIVKRMRKQSKYLTVIPFSFQSDDVIAPLFFRSDITCTRSGGQTAMELMSVGSENVWIHSETKKTANQKKEPSLEELLQGIPGWEAANALYLQKACNAKVVTPETFMPLARQVICRP